MEEFPIIVSACLAGLATTHDGRAKPHPKVLELVRQGKAILVCPEQLGGLPTPRPEAEIVEGGRVLDINGADVTENYLRGAREALKVARLSGSRRRSSKLAAPHAERPKSTTAASREP